MIRISDAAQAHFAKLLANQEEGTQIRVFVINPGTPNAECGVSYCPPDAVEATDTALKFDLGSLAKKRQHEAKTTNIKC